MKNLLLYYLQIFMPIPLMYWSARNEDSSLFLSLLGFYYIYRIFTDYNRLNKKGIIKKYEIFKFIMPFWSIKYFNELYFEK